ncbi:MAG: hypothetical protein ACPGXY_02360 [Alphaproteobacteria bacterium]
MVADLGIFKGLRQYNLHNQMGLQTGSQNMANAQQPGAKMMVLEPFKMHLDNAKSGMIATHDRHIGGTKPGQVDYKVSKSKSTQNMTLSGNNIDREEVILDIAESSYKMRLGTAIYAWAYQTSMLPFENK